MREESGGVVRNVASLTYNIPQFTPDNFGEYTCLALITSDDLPGAQTGVLRTIEIPSSRKFHIYPSYLHVVAEVYVYRFVSILNTSVIIVPLLLQ